MCLVLGVVCVILATDFAQISFLKYLMMKLTHIEPHGFEWVAIGGTLLCIPASKAVGVVVGDDEHPTRRVIVPIMIVLLGISIAVYICNMLTYSRLPLGYVD